MSNSLQCLYGSARSLDELEAHNIMGRGVDCIGKTEFFGKALAFRYMQPQLSHRFYHIR
jgi:hypothetical protein